MAVRVADQIPQYLIQMAAVENDAPHGADLERQYFHGHFLVGTKDPHELFEVGLGIDRLGLRAVAAIQIQHFLHHPVQAMRVFPNDGQQALVFRTALAHFVQQFRRMINAGKRISDFVRDARREPPQRGQLHLLRLGANAPGIFDKDHRRRSRTVADRDKPNLIIALRSRIAQHGKNTRRVVAPFGVQFGQHRRGFGERSFVRLRQPAYQRFALPVMLADHAAFIDDDKTVLHVANDELVDLRQVGQIDAARFGNLLGTARIFGEREAQARNREVAAGQQTALEKIGARGLRAQELPGLLKQDRQCRQRGVKKRQPSARHQSGRSQTDEQQQSNAAFHATGSMHQ